MSNKFVFIQAGEPDQKKYHVVISMCVVNEETFKNLLILEQLRFANLKNIEQTNIDEQDTMAKGIKSYIAPAFKISGNQYFVWDSLKEIIDERIKQYDGYLRKIVEHDNDTIS